MTEGFEKPDYEVCSIHFLNTRTTRTTQGKGQRHTTRGGGQTYSISASQMMSGLVLK